MGLEHSTIAIVGLGLMGGSLALALRGRCRRVVGVARRSETVQKALARQVVDAATCDVAGAVREADGVVLATPVRHIIRSIPQVAAHMRPGSLLMDLGSIKGAVVEAMSALPDGLLAVGGHPMCGREVGGLDNADPTMFRGAAFVLVPTARATPTAMALAEALVREVGAWPVLMDAQRHDRAVALVSHLPYLLASVLMHAEMQAARRDRAVDALAAGGFRDTTRLAAGEVDMMLDILLTNREAVAQALALFDGQMTQVRALLEGAAGSRDIEGELRAWMEQAQRRRREMFV